MAMKQVLVSYGERKKVVKIPLDKPESDLDCITKACHKDFGITESNMTFQRFDPTWDEYVDLEEDSEVHDKDKLKLVVMPLSTMPLDTPPLSEFEVSQHVTTPTLKCSQPCRVLPFVVGDTVELDNTSSLSSESDNEPLLAHPQKRSRPLDSDSGESCSESSTREMKKPKRKKLTVAKTEDDSIPLPDPFPLPKHYPNDLEEALSKGKMSHRQKQAFITEVASSMLRFKRYPSRDDYICVARSIVLKYPFFKQTTGRPYDAIVRSLINRFKEFRRDKKPRNPSVNKTSTISATPSKNGKSPGIMKSPGDPLPPHGEDAVSYERHTKALQVEHKKTKQNKHIVSELMDRSFALRRKEIMESNLYLDVIFDRFPFLQDTEELMSEMQRIMRSDTLRAHSKEHWITMCPKILQQAQLEALHNLRVSNTLDAAKNNTEENIILALALLPLMLPDARSRADPDKIVYFTKGCENVTTVVEDISNLTPYMLIVGNIGDATQAFLVADKKIISDVKFDDLPFCLMAAFFVFNICYPKGCCNFYAFMEVVTLDYPLEKASPTVKHFRASLNAQD